jgi:hypothetical protein
MAASLLVLCTAALCLGLASAGPRGPERPRPERFCPPADPNQRPAPRNTCIRNTNWASNYTIEQLKNLVENACPNTTILVPPGPPEVINVLTDQNVRVMNPDVKLLDPNSRITINFASANPENSCRFSVAAPGVIIGGITFTGKAGACVCSGASRVRFDSPNFLGTFASLRIEAGASVSAVNKPQCDGGMETFCIANAGRVDSIGGADFKAGAKGGAILNLGSIGNITKSQFAFMNGASGGPCAAAAGIIVNAVGATIGAIREASFLDVAATARAIWNDGTISEGIIGSRFIRNGDGAIGNGPTGFINTVANSTFQGIFTNEGGGAVRNLGRMNRIEGNTFKDVRSSNAGGVITVTSDIGDLNVCNVTTFPAFIEQGIFNNTFDGYGAGDGCGGILVANTSRVGQWQAAWNAISGPTWTPPANRATWNGVVGNTFKGGIASDSGVGLCVKGVVSWIFLNTFQGLETADSGGAFEVSRSVAFIGNNTIAGVRITDQGGGLFCSVPNWSPDRRDPLANIKLFRANVVRGVSQIVAGGCIYVAGTCGVEFLVDNRCTTVAVIGVTNPAEPIVYETDPSGGGRNATICLARNNAVDNRPNVLPRSLARCPIRPDGLWYNPVTGLQVPGSGAVGALAAKGKKGAPPPIVGKKGKKPAP